MAGFGGSVKLTGEEAYRAALKGIAADLQKVSAQQKLTAATYDKSDSSLTALSKRSQELQTKLTAQQEKVKTLTAALKDYQSQQEKNKTTIQNLQTQLDKEKAKLEEIGRVYGTNSKEYKEQAKVVNDLEQELKELNTQYDKNETTIKKTEAALTSAEADIKKTGTAMEKLAKQAEEAGVDSKELGLAVDDAGKKAKSAADGGYTVFKNVLANISTQVINRTIQGVKSLGRSVYEAGTNFDSAMSKVQAVSGASASDIEKLTAKAKEMGETTKFSASESAEALNYMAMAGWKTEDMLNGLEGVMNLAAASGSDLATTSDIVTDALTAMGYSAGDAGRLADVMAAASSNANTNVEMMGQTFQYAAPIVGALGYNMEDTAVAIGLMANAGIKGEKAGTALRSVLTRLSAPPAECAKAMQKLGISLTDSEGKMKPLNTVIDDLRKAFDGLSESEQTQLAKNLAGQEAMSGLLAIVNAAPADYAKLTQAVNKSTGAAEKMAATMQDNVGGKMTLLRSQLEGIYLTIWKKVEPVISKTISSISSSLKTVDWNSFGERAGQALQKVADGFKWLLENKDAVINGIKMMVAAFAVAKIAAFTKSLSENLGVTALVTAAQKALATASVAQAAAQGTATAATTAGTTAMRIFNSVLASNPIGLAIAAIGLLGGAIMGVASAFQQGTDATKNLSEELRAQVKELDESKQSWNDLAQAQQESLNKGMSEISHYQDLADELRTITDENGKVKKGYEQRAQFITSTLAEALGIEIKLQDGVVQGYDKIQNSIDQTIAKKKAEIVLNAQEAAYTEAIEKRSEALQRQTEFESQYMAKRAEAAALDDEIEASKQSTDLAEHARLVQKKARLTEEADAIEAQYNEQKALTEQYAWAISQYETNMALFHEGKYDEMSNVNWEYIDDLGNVENAKKTQIDQDIANEKAWISTLQGMRNDSNKKMVDEQIKASKEKIAKLEDERKQYVSTTNKGLKEVENAWDKSLDEQVSKIIGSKVEFRDAGKGQVQMYVDGVATGEKKSKDEMAKIVRNSLAEVNAKKPDANTAGRNLIAGVNDGILNQNQQSSAFRSIANFGNSLLNKLRASLQEHSPSRATNEMGRFLLQGLGLGIEKEEDAVLSQIETFGENVIGTLDSALGEGVSNNTLEALKTAIPAEFNASLSANTSRMAEAAQAPDKSLVGQFKEALSQMKIELDDENVGAFIDKTVTNLVYN